MRQCCICYADDGLGMATFKSCSHFVCVACFRTMVRFDMRCPLCKVVVLEAEGVTFSITPHPASLTVSLPERRGLLGITIGDEKGVVTVRSAERSAQPFLHKGDTLVAINGIPMTSVKCATQLFHTQSPLEVQIVRENKQRSRFCIPSCFKLKFEF